MTPAEILKTPDEWLADEQFAGVTVLDPDGWDRRNFAEDWAIPLTLNEFSERLASSTVTIDFSKNGTMKEARDLAIEKAEGWG